MRRKSLLASLICLLAISLILAGCTEETTPTPTSKTPTPAAQTPTPTVAVDWWDELGKPQYGGDFTLRNTMLSSGWDPYNAGGGAYLFMFDTLFIPSWTLDREIWSFKPGFTPADYRDGCLVEEWEMPNDNTYILHIREGITWQDKEPVNGREFTAYDVEHHYHRVMGVGEYSEPSPYMARNIANIESVTATDDHAVEFKFKTPGLSNFQNIADLNSFNYIEAPESVALGTESMSDWDNAVGTGPWILTGYVDGVSMEYVKNPNYWNNDERHPENQLPYFDTLTLLVITDNPTALAALRTGQIDFMQGISWQDSQSLGKSNPEIEQVSMPTNGMSVLFRCDHEPFTDVRVRKALQMAVNLEELAEGYYGGSVDGTPAGLISPALIGYAYPYEDWSQSLKDEYAFNPEAARALLAEAGFPGGFNTSVLTANAGPRADLQLLQVIKAYFFDIGVDMEIEAVDQATLANMTMAGLHEQMFFTDDTAYVFGPDGVIIKRKTGDGSNYTYNNDLVYDAIVDEFNAAMSTEVAAQLVQKADKYCIEQHWAVNTFSLSTFNVLQPDIKGYSGEPIGYVGAWGQGQILARLWRSP